MPEKIMVALSGGVDSALAMALLKQEGFELRAAYMKTWMNEEGIDVFGDCPWHQDIIDATACAEKIGVPFEVADMIEEYRKQIVEYLVDEYRRGRTPNPDVMCNRKMKFGKFLDFALSRGCDKVATGHYCCLRDNPDGTRDLMMGADPRQRPIILPLHDNPEPAYARRISDRVSFKEPSPGSRPSKRPA